MSSMDVDYSAEKEQPSLSIYTVNCNHSKQVLLGGMGSKSRGTAYDVLACQELGEGCTAQGYDCIALYQDTVHHNAGLNVGLFLRNADSLWQKADAKSFKLPETMTGRGVAQIALSSRKNAKFVVWIATLHCKSGQYFGNSAQAELGALLKYVLDCGTMADAKIIIVTGDMNWGSVKTWANDNQTKYKTYLCQSYLGDDQMSGKSLMQTVVFYVPSKVDGSHVEMSTLARTTEGHAILHTKITSLKLS
ncbi:hypothetical protein PMN64_15830 [Bradyrhizobium sp. UFLA01-814]|uniref:hypothetical protein n=1 Tax=Bradyrhizobium sp. UFLA01-814 TaxID=3023480 RepID=UPI00398B418A